MQAGMLKILSYTWALRSPETHQPSKSSASIQSIFKIILLNFYFYTNCNLNGGISNGDYLLAYNMLSTNIV